MEKHFNSPAEIVAFVGAGQCNSYRDMNKPNWFGYGDSFLIQQKMAAGMGDERLVQKAKGLIDKLSVSFPETDRIEFSPSVAGAYPCVPDVLMGLPEHMRARNTVATEGAPIRIGVYTGCSASITAEEFSMRASCVLAIVMHLTNTGRAVELFAVDSGNGNDGETLITVKLETNPISLAQIGHALTNLGFTRRICYGAQEAMNNGYCGAWPRDYDKKNNGRNYTAALAKRLELSVLLPSLFGSEAAKIAADPIAWTTKQYAAIQARIEDGELAA